MTAEPLPLNDQLDALFANEHDAVQQTCPIHNRLREEAPVYLMPNTTMALIAEHHTAKSAFRDVKRYAQTDRRGNPLEGRLDGLSAHDLELLEEIVEFERSYVSRKNGPDQRRIRAAVGRYLTPRRVAEMEPAFQATFDALLADWEGQEVVDLMPVAYRLPLLVITDLLGVPRDDAEQIKAWGDAINAPTRQHPLTPELVQAAHQAIVEHRAYVHELIHRQRQDLTGAPSDLVESMLDASADARVSEEELVAFFVHTLFAGHETTQFMIANGMFAFMNYRDQWDQLRQDPSLAVNAVDEIVRWDGPVTSMSKHLTEDTEVDGVTIPAGSTVALMMTAANHDPKAFDGPERFDITRPPNDHLGFGHGPHFCLGASLARLEGKVVFTTLAERYPDIQLAADPSEITYHGGLRGVNTLPLRLRP